MFVRCRVCGWSTDDRESVGELAELVAEAGGVLLVVSIGDAACDVCPGCRAEDSLTID